MHDRRHPCAIDENRTKSTTRCSCVSTFAPPPYSAEDHEPPSPRCAQTLLEAPLTGRATTGTGGRARAGAQDGTVDSWGAGRRRESKKKQEKLRLKELMRNVAPRPIAPRPTPSPIEDGSRFWDGLAAMQQAKKAPSTPKPAVHEEKLAARRAALGNELLVCLACASPPLLSFDPPIITLGRWDPARDQRSGGYIVVLGARGNGCYR